MSELNKFEIYEKIKALIYDLDVDYADYERSIKGIVEVLDI